MMKKMLFGLALFLSVSAVAQDNIQGMQQTARAFMMEGDYDNAILVLTRALQQDKKNLELQKDLVQCYYYKRDFEKARKGAEELVDRSDADVISYQIAGNVYKALEEAKEADKLYRQGLKKFPKSGPLYSEYGELLWARKDFTAIQQWEKGIETDPGYSGNYYNAALFYYYTKDKVWTLVYGEIFVNMESLSERGAAMKELLLQAYKEKLFVHANLLSGEEGNKSAFAKAFLECMNRQSSIMQRGVTVESLTMARTRFLLDWFNEYASRFPFKLLDYQQQLVKEGMFEAYNQWLFGPVENLAAYDNWTKLNSEAFTQFSNFQSTRVFRMPAGQYYQAKN